MTATEPSWDLTALQGVWGERNVDTVDRGRTMEGAIVYLVTTHRKGTMPTEGLLEHGVEGLRHLHKSLHLFFTASAFLCLLVSLSAPAAGPSPQGRVQGHL